jgi:hypothetical protein
MNGIRTKIVFIKLRIEGVDVDIILIPHPHPHPPSIENTINGIIVSSLRK